MKNTVFRSGSGAYSCVAENEGGMAEGNATIVITESITYIGKARVTITILCTYKNQVIICNKLITETNI